MPLAMALKKHGRPVCVWNLKALWNTAVPHPAQLYTPSRVSLCKGEL
jgi:hypothetical protein